MSNTNGLKAWRADLWDVMVYVAASTRGKARYITAKMAADAELGSVGQALSGVRCVRAPEWDHVAATKDKPGSLHPMEQWVIDEEQVDEQEAR